MQLKVLPDRNVCNASCVPLGDVRNRAHLPAAQEAIRDTNPHHEVGRALALSARAADDSRAISLGVHAPRPEIRAKPLRWDRSIALLRKLADVVEMLPGILRVLQTLDTLRFRLFDFAHRSITCLKSLFQKQKTHVA